MPRVREIEDDSSDPILREVFAGQRERFGDLLNTAKVMAHCPPILAAAQALGAAIERSGQLPKGFLPLVYLRVATLNGCPFWIDINSLRVREGDGGEEKMLAVPRWRDSPVFSPAERAALDYAEHMTLSEKRVEDGLFAELRRHFTEAQIVELTAAIAFENFRSKLNPALGVEAQGFCPLPER